MEGEKGETSSSILIFLVSNFAINLIAAQQNKFYQDEKKNNIAGQSWSLKGFHYRAKTFVNTEKKQAALKKITLFPGFSWEQRLTLGDRCKCVVSVLFCWPYEFLQNA